MIANSTHFTTYVRRSLIVCVKLKRPDKRLPSAKRICIDVVGCDASTFNFSFALKNFINKFYYIRCFHRLKLIL